jgi:hypothetical protein
MFRLSPVAYPTDAPSSGQSADAGHYLVLGLDKSIVLPCGSPAQ